MSGIMDKVKETLHMGGHKEEGEKEKHHDNKHKEEGHYKKESGHSGEHKEGLVDKIKEKIHGQEGGKNHHKDGKEKKKKKKEKKHDGHGHDSSSSSDSD